MRFFMEHMTMAYLDGAVVSKQWIGLNKYKHVILENKFLMKLNSSPQYTKLWNFERFSKWFEYEISNVATNLLQWCNIL